MPGSHNCKEMGRMRPHQKSRLLKKSRKAGLSPGTPVFTGTRKVPEITITIRKYHEQAYEEQKDASIEDVCALRDRSTCSWVDICGLHDVEAIQKIGACFGIHPLVIEDIVHTEQRVKVDEYEGYLFLVLRDLHLPEGEERFESDQVSIIVTRNCLLSFQEKAGDAFDPVRKRLEAGRGRLRAQGIDYLAYALLDATVDGYFGLLEKFGEDIENIEEELLSAPSPQALTRLHLLRRQMLLLRRSVWPLREVVGAIERQDSPIIQPTTRLYLRDVYDHAVRLIESIETSRDLLSNILEVYLSNVSNKTNDVMKTLTAITAIFIPLTLISSIYGMNFQNMPELAWPYGYYIVLAVMFVLALLLFLVFRRRKWI